MATSLRDSEPEPDGGKALECLAQRIKASTKRTHVRIVRVCSRPIKDEDNLFGSVRYILNALKYSKLILDDSKEAIRLEVTEEVSSTHRGTRIEITYP
jgi:hypothetical protein